MRQKLDEPCSAHDRCTWDKFAGIKGAFLEAWRTHEDGPTGFHKTGDQVFEGLKALFVDRVGCALDGQAGGRAAR